MNTKSLLKMTFLLLVATFTACSGGEKKENTAAKQTEETTKAKVKVEKVVIHPVDQLAIFTATVEADVINHIASSRPMRIKKIYVDVGSKVTKGQKLVEMDHTSMAGQQAQLQNLEKEYSRLSELLKVGGASQQQVDQLFMQLEVARETMKNLVEDTYLISPITGIVTARNYDEGDVMGQNPIVTVQQMNPVKALINVSESYYSKVKEGMAVDLKLDVYGDENFNGKVSLIYPTIDPTSHTFTTEVKINNGNMKVRPGMFSRVTMNFGTENRAVVPDNAIIKQPGSNDRYVYVVENGVAKYVKVELGQRLANKYEIISGLKDGDTIVTVGQSRLSDNTPVEIIE